MRPTRLQRFLVPLFLLMLGGCGGCNRGNLKSKLDAESINEHNRAVALMGQFNYTAAFEILESLTTRYPDKADFKIDLAIAALNRREPGDREKALQLLREAAKANPENLRAYYCQGILLLDGGEPEAALEAFSKVADKDPNDAYAIYYTGLCLSQVGRTDEALENYKASIQLEPYFRSGYYGAFRALQQTGKLEEAQPYLEQFQKLDGNPQARLAEIKYTRMGPKAEVLPIEVDSSVLRKPVGPIFAQPQNMNGLSLPAGCEWRPQSMTITACDINGDESIDLFLASGAQRDDRLNVVLINDQGTFQVATDHPLMGVNNVNAALWGDFDNDGLTDVYLCRSGPNQLWRQTAPTQWQDVTDSTKTSGGDIDTINGAFFDADHDGDLDIFLANDGFNELLNNNLDGTFRSLAAEYQLAGEDSKSIQIVVADLDNDRDVDIVVVNEGGSHAIFENDRLWEYHPANGFDAFAKEAFSAVVAADTNADGHVELLTSSGNTVSSWQPNAEHIWSPSRLCESDSEVTAMSIADLNGDGILDLILQTRNETEVRSTTNGESLQELAINGAMTIANLTKGGPTIVALDREDQLVQFKPGSGRYPFVTLALSGKDDSGLQMRSNRSGIGVHAAVRVGTRWSAFNTFPSNSLPGQSLQPVQIGLGESGKLDFVQMTWPDGVFQTEMNLSSDQAHKIVETQRQVASCPVIFVWNGEKFEFFTDCLGVGGIGFNLGKGEYGMPRPWENLIIPNDLIEERDGRFEIRIAEPMEETCYLDAARLVRYDLPTGWSMALDERYAIGEPAPTGEPIFFKREIVPITAVNDRGKSILTELANSDNHAAPIAPVDVRFLGRTEDNVITLTFEEPIDEIDAVLMFDGWVEYPYSQTMFAAWQANASYDAPTLEALGKDGEWKTIYKNFGYMAGMPRQSALPLPKDRLPEKTMKLRLTTNLEIYWDRIVIAERLACPEATKATLQLESAIVAEIGFPKRTTLAQRRPYYEYLKRTPLWDTRYMTGFYTAFGSALPLVKSVDDSVAIFGPGEEIRLSFATSAPQTSNSRFVLELNGWAKDKDLYTLDGDTVGPLPRRNGVVPQSSKSIQDEFNQRFRSGF